MSEFSKHDAYNSPMEVVFSWATPQKSEESSTSTKRKSEDDSGYASPCSTKLRPVQSTPYQRTGEVAFTPYGEGNIAKKRLDVSNAHGNLCYSNVGTAESYSEFLMEESLYSEPMELGTSSSPAGSLEESKGFLSLNEISKDLDVEFAFGSCGPSPSTPEAALPPRKVALSTIKRTPKKSLSPKKRLTSSAPSQTVYWQRFRRRRNFTGLEKVDFLYQLGTRAYYPSILSKILNYLSDSDLSNVTMVSKTWNSVCLANTAARLRWRNYANERKQNRENLPLKSAIVGKPKRQSLRDSNHSTPLVTRQPTSPPVSPSKIRFHMFQKEARNLKENEVLMECPRCRRPSACSPSLRVGECTALFCQFKFCTICKTDSHPRSECPVLTPATPTTPTKRPVSIGSKQSRRNLRRL